MSKELEALECLGYIENKLKDLEYIAKQNDNEYLLSKYIPSEKFDTIKQALLKAQEQEVVVKALQNGIYVKDMPREDLIKQFGLKLSNIETEWYLSNNIMCVNLKDYKKLFWLKEDKSE